MRFNIAILLAALLIGAAFTTSAAAEEGVTDTEIHIGTFGPLSGPAAAWGGVIYGIETMCNLINEKGGLHGRKIVLHIVDDGYNPAKTMAGVKQMQEGVGIFAWIGGIGTAPSLAVLNYLGEKGVPWFGACSGAEELINPPKRNVFACYPINSGEAALLCRYTVATLGRKKIAMAFQNDPYGQNGFQGAKAELARHHLELVAAVAVEKNDQNMMAVADKLRRSEAEAVLIWLNNLSALQVLQACKKMGYAPQWLAPVSFSDFKVSYAVSRGLIEGMITDSTLDINHPNIPMYQEAHRRLGRKDVAWTEYVGYGVAFTEAVEWALDHTGRDLTREAFIEQSEKLSQFRQGIGGQVQYLSFDPKNPESRNGMQHVFLKQCLKDGESKLLTDRVALR